MINISPTRGARDSIMFYLIKFLVNSLIYILRYILIGMILSLYALLCIGIVIPITIIFSIFKWMWKFKKEALINGYDYIIYLLNEFIDLYVLNKPKFKTWK